MVDTLLAKILKFVVIVLAAMLTVVVVLSTAHLEALIGEEIWKHRKSPKISSRPCTGMSSRGAGAHRSRTSADGPSSSFR